MFHAEKSTCSTRRELLLVKSDSGDADFLQTV